MIEEYNSSQKVRFWHFSGSFLLQKLKSDLFRLLFLLEVSGLRREPTLGESPAQASRVRSVFAKRTKFFEAKHVGTFNASAARLPGEFFIVKKRGLSPLFDMRKFVWLGREPTLVIIYHVL